MCYGFAFSAFHSPLLTRSKDEETSVDVHVVERAHLIDEVQIQCVGCERVELVVETVCSRPVARLRRTWSDAHIASEKDMACSEDVLSMIDSLRMTTTITTSATICVRCALTRAVLLHHSFPNVYSKNARGSQLLQYNHKFVPSELVVLDDWVVRYHSVCALYVRIIVQPPVWCSHFPRRVEEPSPDVV